DESADSAAARDEPDRADKLRQQVHQELRRHCRNPEVATRLNVLARALWAPNDEAFAQWLAKRFKATLGQAVLLTCQTLSPQFVGEDVLLDLDYGPRPSASDELEEIWITEETPGGAGIIEQIVDNYADDPRRFFELVQSALGASDLEIVDIQLTRLL